MDDTKSIYEQYAVHIVLLITHRNDGSWQARYPEADWSVTADTEEAAKTKIREEAERRLSAGQDSTGTPVDILERHLAHPIPGIYAMDTELFLYLRQTKGTAETERAFAEAERRRALGQDYTRGDYEREAVARDQH